MTKLNQLIAIERGVKTTANKAWTEAYHSLQKQQLLTGISRTYVPKDDDGDKYPAESTKVQLETESVIEQTSKQIARLFDVVATKEWANQTAVADVVVNGTVLLEKVPVTYLLFLEKQLTDLTTFVSKLPVLDPAIDWEYDPSTACFRSSVVETNKSKKIPRNHVKAEATDKHPAQVEIWQEDVVVGTWSTTHFSGAMEQSRVSLFAKRVEELQNAVKFAREAANGSDIVDVAVGEKVLAYIFA